MAGARRGRLLGLVLALALACAMRAAAANPAYTGLCRRSRPTPPPPPPYSNFPLPFPVFFPSWSPAIHGSQQPSGPLGLRPRGTLRTLLLSRGEARREGVLLQKSTHVQEAHPTNTQIFCACTCLCHDFSWHSAAPLLQRPSLAWVVPPPSPCPAAPQRPALVSSNAMTIQLSYCARMTDLSHSARMLDLSHSARMP